MTTYVDQLQEQRSAAVATIERVTVEALRHEPPLSREEWSEVSESLEPLRQERDALGQQIAWGRRATGWAWPKQPAWTD